MEAKTLLKLIKDDIAHLEGITGDFLVETLPASDEVELALVRAKALQRELELLYKLAGQHESIYASVKLSDEPKVEVQEHDQSEQVPFKLFASGNIDDELGNTLIHGQQDLLLAEIVSKPELNVEVQNNTEALPEVLNNNIPVEAHFTALVEPLESVDAQSNETNADKIEEPLENTEEATVDQEDAAEEFVTTIESAVVQDIPEQSEEILAEEFKEVKKTLNETLGDSHQMVNDILSPEKDETGYKIIPINSIWDGIGINDRFLFIRELFANSSAKLENTVTALDKLATIQDAVTYLKMNFKWNKTEASHKFLLLVKRRFTK